MEFTIENGITYLVKGLNSYYFQARFTPSTLGLLPLITQVIFILVDKYGPLLSTSAGDVRNVFFVLGAIGTISLALVFLLIPITLAVSRHLIEPLYFREGEVSMPTTYLLMEVDRTLSSQNKKLIRKAIREEFNLSLLSQKEEEYQPEEQKRIIVEAVRQIREVTRSDQILLGKNIRYGGLRNFLGSFLCGSLLTALSVLFWPLFDATLWVGSFLSVLAAFSAFFYKKVAEDYAESLFTSFLNRTFNTKKRTEKKSATILVEP